MEEEIKKEEEDIDDLSLPNNHVNFEVCRKRYICTETDCIASSDSELTMRQHIREVHKEPIQCPYDDCQKRIRLDDLAEHVQATHHSEQTYENSSSRVEGPDQFSGKQFLCQFENCNFFFDTQWSLRSHLRSMHNVLLKCSYKDYGKSEIAKPPRGRRPKLSTIKVQCDNCKTEVQQTWIKNHILRCTNYGKKDFKCGMENCESSFESKGDLKVHMIKIHYEKKICENCGQYIPRKSFDAHFEFCTKKYKFPCTFEDCKVSCATKVDMAYHVSKMHEALIKCPHDLCNMYVKSYLLKVHMKSFHENLESRVQKKKSNPVESELGAKIVIKDVHLLNSVSSSKEEKNS